MVGLKDFEKDEELRIKHILENMLYVCDIQPKNMFIYLHLFDNENKYKMNWYRGSFLDEGFDKCMKDVWKLDNIDIIVGNPPYNKGLYLKFIEKSIKLCDILNYVCPSTFTINLNEEKYVELLKKNGLYYIKFLGFDTFDVNQSTLFFISDKNNSNIIVNNININEDIRDYKNIIEYNILSKIKKLNKIELYQGKNENINYNNKVETYNIKFTSSDEFNIKMFSRLGCGKNIEYYYIRKDLDIKQNKNVFPRGTANYNSISNHKKLDRDFTFNLFVDKNVALSKSIMYIPVLNEEHYKKLSWYICRSKWIRYIFIKYNTFEELTKKIFKYFIPEIDLNEDWNDEKLYNFFNLTQEEIDLIENTIK